MNLDDPIRRWFGLRAGAAAGRIDGNELRGHTGTIPGFGAVTVYWRKVDASLAVISNLSVFDWVGVQREGVSVIRAQVNVDHIRGP